MVTNLTTRNSLPVLSKDTKAELWTGKTILISQAVSTVLYFFLFLLYILKDVCVLVQHCDHFPFNIRMKLNYPPWKGIFYLTRNL